MSTPSPEAPAAVGAVAQERLHALLQVLAGRIEDGQLTMARAFLAEGWIEEAAATAHDALELTAAGRPAAPSGVPAPVRTALDDARSGDVATVDHDDLATRSFFAPLPAPSRVEGGLDQAVAVAVLSAQAARAYWLAWRRPGGGAGAGVPVHVVELDGAVGPGAAARCAGVVQAALAARGAVDPQVEVVRAGDRPPAYQRAARAAGRLVWAEAERPRLRLARVHDRPGEGGQEGFRKGHPVLPVRRREELCARLAVGTVLLQTSAPLPDVVDAARPLMVPDVFRTDGRWVWHDATTYYLRRYGLAPQPAFLSYLLGLGDEPPELPVDGVVLRRALRWLTSGAGTAAVPS